MDLRLVIEDARDSSLNFGEGVVPAAKPVHGFFQFADTPATFNDPGVLKDCYFYNLYINYFVSGWGENPPPHPGLFEDCFPEIVSRLIQRNVLTLHIKSFDPSYFDEEVVIKQLLEPKKLAYILLSDNDLFFEWHSDSLDYVVEQWFMSPIVSIEGYVSEKSVLGCISNLYSQPDSEVKIRELLANIEFGFQLWPDNNGLYVLTDKIGPDALAERLDVSSLSRELQSAVEKLGNYNPATE